MEFIMNIKIKSLLPSILCLFIGMLFFYSMRALPIAMPPELNTKFIMGLISCVFLLLLSKVFLRYEDIKSSAMHLLPNNKTLMRLFMGLVIGAVIVGVMLYTLFTFTNLDLNRVETQTMTSFMLASLVFIPLALMEEILFRGYPFFRISQLINIRWVILITSVVFALYHFNGTSSIVSLLLGPGVWGVTFGVAAYLSKSIAVPLGIHISANALQALFGLKSGYVPLWEISKSTELFSLLEPDHLGIIMQFLLLIVSILVLEYSLWKKDVIRIKVAKIKADINSNPVTENN